MSIAIKCTHCGKGLKVPDDRLGKLAKCPACGETFTVMPANSALGGKPSKKPEEKFAEHRGVHVPVGLFVFIGVAIAIIAVVAGIIFGPLRIWRQWEATEPHAQSTVEDVITRGLQSYVSHQGWFDPKKSSFNAGVRQMAFTFMPYNLSMPEKVPFAGVSTQGNFTGSFYPKTGEVDVQAEVGARTFEGLTQDMSKPAGSIHITGREPNGQLSVEVDGKDATVETSTSATP
jgi:hypothetical protein